MKTFDEMKLDSLTEEEFLTEISLGKVSSTMMIGKLLTQIRNVKDKELGQVLRTLGILIYITSLQHKSKKKEDKSKSKKKKTIFHKKSDAGKGDSPRKSITQDEWGKKWEKIFRSKKKK